MVAGHVALFERVIGGEVAGDSFQDLDEATAA
jgi:hypothetical protein